MDSRSVLAAAIPTALALLVVSIPPISQANVTPIAQYHLLIVAPDEFIDELKPLKRFKDASARPTLLLSLTQVYESFPGVDEPEKVKRCIAHYEATNGMDYVMLVGDVDKFPVRWRWWGWAKRNPDGTIIPGKDQRGWAVSDLYYADLYWIDEQETKHFDDWNNNPGPANDLYGEIVFSPDGTINNDNIDFLPDVAVGRVPASTPAEVTAYVNKVIAYEMATFPTATWFKKAALYTGCADSWDNWNKDKVGESLSSSGFTLLQTSADQRIRYGHWLDPCPPTPTPCCEPPLNMPQTIVNDLNSGVGFANYIGHGNSGSWGCVGFGTTQLGQLSNSGELPVAFAVACDTGMFAHLVPGQHYIDTNNVEHCGITKGETLTYGAYPYVALPRPNPLQQGQVVCNSVSYGFDIDCFAETFIFGNPTGPTGAIAYLGARSGGRQWARMLDQYFFEAYDIGGHRILGDMWKYMIEEYYDYYDLASANTWPHTLADWDWGHRFDEPQKLIVFGDPSLVVGGAFTLPVSGNVYDWMPGWIAPWLSFFRYRMVGDVTVPEGETLTAQPYASILFEDGRKITAIGTGPNEGLIVNATSDLPVYFMSMAADPQSERVVHGMIVRGQLRLRNGGELRLH